MRDDSEELTYRINIHFRMSALQVFAIVLTLVMCGAYLVRHLVWR